jgi:hypothetical protein
MQSYVQADIEGQAIVWLMPHCVAQVLPKDVDFRVMLTFLEFYHTLLQFILFKLYHRLGLKYPPGMPEEVEHAAAELQVIIKEVAGLQDGEVAKRREEASGLTCAVLEFGCQLCVPNPFFVYGASAFVVSCHGLLYLITLSSSLAVPRVLICVPWP